MPFSRPTLATLVDRVRGDFKSRLGISGAIVRRTMANVLATVWAGSVHMLHGHLEWLGKQLFADQADRDFLIRHASIYGLTPTAATYAAGSVDCTGTNGSAIPLGAVLVRDDGALYETTSAAVIAGGVATVSIVALDAGAAGDMVSGDVVSFQSPQTGVDAEATVASGGVTGGNDEEDTEDFRARLLLRIQEPPQGGADQDYEAWSLAVAGVTRVWVRAAANGPGTVTVYFVRDDDSPIIPDAGEVAAVQAAIDAERPITADVTVAAPTASAVNFTISISPDTAAARAAIEAELSDMLFRDAEPGDGVSVGTIYLSRIISTIGLVDDVDDFTVTVPAADVVPAAGGLATMGTVSWV